MPLREGLGVELAGNFPILDGYPAVRQSFGPRGGRPQQAPD